MPDSNVDKERDVLWKLLCITIVKIWQIPIKSGKSEIPFDRHTFHHTKLSSIVMMGIPKQKNEYRYLVWLEYLVWLIPWNNIIRIILSTRAIHNSQAFKTVICLRCHQTNLSLPASFCLIFDESFLSKNIL